MHSTMLANISARCGRILSASGALQASPSRQANRLARTGPGVHSHIRIGSNKERFEFTLDGV
jgi:hypothetical protein